MAPRRLQIAWARAAGRAIEAWLEAEREQLVLWIPVMLGAGIAAWFVLPDRPQWLALIAAALGIALAGIAAPWGTRAGRVLLIGGMAVAAGCALIWVRAERVAAPVLARPAIVQLTARVERVEPLVARGLFRLRLTPIADPALPHVVRVNLPVADAPPGLGEGAVTRLGARLMPPAAPALPGAYDYARVAWFDRVGATGRGFGPVTVLTPAGATGGLRARLSAHIRTALPGAEGAIAASFATGDQGAIAEEDAEAMRRSGLAHLLSVSGLHITAVVAATMVVTLRLLALSQWAATTLRLPMIAAGAGAVAAIGYTLLTGAEVPTIRSCVAALLVLAAMALGRQAVTLRLVAAGALAVLLFRPEALVGPSFQLSFAAVAAIVALHEAPRVRGWFEPREETGWRRLARHLGSLLLTGIVVEAALLPVVLFHFHKAGLYGAAANIVAIPLTTFVVMPLEALALALDPVGLSTPFWWLCGKALTLLLWLAHATAAAPGAIAALPAMSRTAFALMVAGLLWLGLWRTRIRLAGLVPVAIGAALALATPYPDVLVTGDGRHLAVRLGDGGMALLRERAGDYVRDMLAEGGGTDAPLPAIDDVAGARCSADACVVSLTREGRRWRLFATRSPYRIDIATLHRACAEADLVVSDRRLPAACRPRWWKLDRAALTRTGGVAISLAPFRMTRVTTAAAHPWLHPPTVAPPPPNPHDGGWTSARATRHFARAQPSDTEIR